METVTQERPPAPGVPASPAAPVARSKLLALLVAMRPQEWIKNLLVFAGLLFSGKLDEGAQVLDATLAFTAFCAISSAGYLFNDLRDMAHDRQHPEKRLRPIASGALPAATAWLFCQATPPEASNRGRRSLLCRWAAGMCVESQALQKESNNSPGHLMAAQSPSQLRTTLKRRPDRNALTIRLRLATTTS